MGGGIFFSNGGQVRVGKWGGWGTTTLVMAGTGLLIICQHLPACEFEALFVFNGCEEVRVQQQHVCQEPTHTRLGGSPWVGSDQESGDKEDSTDHGQEEA